MTAPLAPHVLVLAGLPAAGKTTAAGRVHGALGGMLIRSCDVFQALGISLPAWVARTRGFTREVSAYESVRDRAYAEMSRRLALSLEAGAGLVLLDAVHAERAKRRAVYALCHARGASVSVLWCRCDDPGEIHRRLARRRGDPGRPENEAWDPAVFHHLAGLWEPPADERLPDGRAVPVYVYDTRADVLVVPPDAEPALAASVGAALGAAAARS